MRALALFAMIVAAAAGAAAAPSAPADARPVAAGTAAAPSASYVALIAQAEAAMLLDPDVARTRARAVAVALAGTPPTTANRLALAKAYWLEGEALARLNRLAEGGPMIERALTLAQQHARGGKLHADVLRSRAGIAAQQGRVRAALEDNQRAYTLLARLDDRRGQSITLIDIGALYGEARDHRRALAYYAQAEEIYSKDPAVLLAVFNGRGSEFKELKDLPQAEAEFRKALTLARGLDSAWLEARILANIGSVQLLRGRPRAADATAVAGLLAAARERSTGWEPHLWGIRAQAAFATGNTGSAADYIKRTFDGVNLDKSTLDYRDFHAAAERIYTRIGAPALALAHLRAVKRLDDEAVQLVNSTSAALLGARFDFANQNLRIARLKAGQLERDVQLAQSRERLQRITLVGVLVSSLTLLTAAVIAAVWLRRSRNRVRGLNDDLSKANRALGRALKAKSEFLATTSHEIRTPLNGILGMTQVMRSDLTLSAAHRERLSLLQSAGETMSALIDDLLDVAKIEKGKLTLDVGVVEIKRILFEVGQLWSARLSAGAVTLRLDLDACPEHMLGDARHLRQIVFNLMSNAVKFTQSGEIVLAAMVEQTADRARVLVRVTDTGVGIPETEYEAIFDSFYQIDGGTTRQFSGTGLGLAICRNFARAMEGDVTVTSIPGKGSTFTLALPFIVPVVDVAPPAVIDAGDWPRDFAQCRVLFVEPNLLRQSMLAAVFAEAVEDFAVVPYWQQAAGSACHYLVLDIANAGAIPSEVLGALARGVRARITVLAPGSSTAATDALLSCGVFRVIDEPVELMELAGVIENVHSLAFAQGAADRGDDIPLRSAA